MVRPRNLLMAWDTSLSSKDASDILRIVDGDIEAAKRYITAERNNNNKKNENKNKTKTKSCNKTNNSITSATTIKTTAAESGKNESKNKENNSETTTTTTTAPTSLLQGDKHQQQQQQQQQQQSQQAGIVARVPPSHITSINNLSDRQYCCVWSVEVYEDGYRPDVARALLATVARHVNPILRERGWRCKRLIESASSKWIGLCTGNNRADADAASTNIQLNLRTQPDKHCTTFRSFHQILSVMLHEITHTSIGLEDIHPPAFYELLNEIKIQYKEKLLAGEVDLETDDYGCNGQYITSDGSVGSVTSSAADLLLGHKSGVNNLDDMMNKSGSETECGAKKRGKGRRRYGGGGSGRSRGGGGGKSKGYTSNVINEKKHPLLKGAKLIDKRTKVGKEAMEEIANLTPRELAAKAAMARFSSSSSSSSSNGVGGGGLGRTTNEKGTGNKGMKTTNGTGGRSGEEICIDDDNNSTDNESDNDDDNEDDEDERIVPHTQRCACRSCDWSKIFLESTT
jgi:hypothetical protein